MRQRYTNTTITRCPFHGKEHLQAYNTECNEWGEPSVTVLRCTVCSYEVRAPYVGPVHHPVDAIVEIVRKP